MLKSYRALNHIRLVTEVQVDGVTGVIEFKGGDRAKQKCGEFTTSNAKLQCAIESSPQYGKEYILVRKRSEKRIKKEKSDKG